MPNAPDILWVYAASREAAGVASLPGRMLELGVGKTEATLRLTQVLAERPPTLVIAFGVAGAYPAGHGEAAALEVGDLCVVVADTLADEGVETPGGFQSVAELGLGDPGPHHADVDLCRRLAKRLGVPTVHGATVSTCSGTDQRSRSLAGRTGASVETMEGAAIGRVCNALRIPWAQLRAISNRTGDRDAAGWNLDAAVAKLHEGLAALAGDPSWID